MNELVEIVDEPLLATATWLQPNLVSQKYPMNDHTLWLGRNANDERDPVGRIDDSHVLLCAKTRSVKGRALIIPNLLSWRGSLFCYDPKGENASITATRRGTGSDAVKTSLNQKTIVLDAHHTAKVPDTYRGHYNPLNEIDPNDPNGPTIAGIIAESCISSAPRTDSSWDEMAESFIKSLALHIVSSPYVPDSERNLVTLRKFALSGDYIAKEHIEKKLSAEQLKENPPNAFRLLLQAMKKNTAFGGLVSDAATDLLETINTQPKGWNSVRMTAGNCTKWIDDTRLREVLVDRGDANDRKSRTFRAADLQHAPNGLSVYLCIPSSQKNTLAAWPRMVVNLILFAAQENQNKHPATGHQTLMMLDEFASLQKMPKIETAAADIAGAGIKMFFVVQSLTQIKAVYGDGWEAFLSSADTHIYYGFNDNFTAEYVSKRLGEIEVIRRLRSGSKALQNSRAVADQIGGSTAEGHTHGHSHGMSMMTGTGGSDSHSRGDNKGGSRTLGWGPSIFLKTLKRSQQEGTSWGQNRNRTRQKSWNQSKTITSSTSDSVTATHTESWSQTITETRGRTDTEGWSESLHKKPLAAINELMHLFGSIEDEEDPQYPGIGLISPASGLPFMVQKTFYDRDHEFEGQFEPHPKHGFKTLPPPPKIYGANCFKTIEFHGDPRIRIRPIETVQTFDEIKQGDPFASVTFNDQVIGTMAAPIDIKLLNTFDYGWRGKLEDEVFQLQNPAEQQDFLGQNSGIGAIEPETRQLEVRIPIELDDMAWQNAIAPVMQTARTIDEILKLDREIDSLSTEHQRYLNYFNREYSQIHKQLLVAVGMRAQYNADKGHLDDLFTKLRTAKRRRQELGYSELS